MAQIDTILPFPHLLFEKSGWRGIALDVLVVRGTFDFGSDGAPMRLADKQTPLVWGDNCSGPPDADPLDATLTEVGDLVVGKPGTDILFCGSVHSPQSKPASDWMVAVRIGTLIKAMRVTGPRRFERRWLSWLGWRVTAAAPVTSVALDYRLAFGGRVSAPYEGGVGALHFAANPVGAGWLPTNAELAPLPRAARRAIKTWRKQQRALPAPQIDELNRGVRKPWQRPVPQGMGPIARWWQPRLARQGTLDAAWLTTRYPMPADDYDPRYVHSAHPDLISAVPLLGDEEVILSGCLPEGKVMTRLPGLTLQAMTRFANGRHSVMPMALDTVHIDLDKRQCCLVWRTLYDRCNPPAEISITALPISPAPTVSTAITSPRASHEHA